MPLRERQEVQELLHEEVEWVLNWRHERTKAVRLSEDKIKEAILHPDLDVRDTAIRYFYSSTDLDHTLMPLAIQAIEQYGRIKAFSFTHYLNLLPQTEQTIGWVIAELQRDFEGLPEEPHFYYLNLSRLLCHADIRLVAQHAPEILHASHFDPKERLAFRERLEMFGWNAEKCWQELRQYCEANKGKNNLEDFDLGHALRIVEALARQPHEYPGSDRGPSFRAGCMTFATMPANGCNR